MCCIYINLNLIVPLLNYNYFRAQTEEYDYEKDEDDPMSDEEVEINEKQSECDDLTNVESQPIKIKHNTSDSEINIEDDNIDDFVNNKDYSQIVIDIK